MVSDGWRDRYFYGTLRRILVVTCGRCNRYDRLLPADVCAYRDATLDQVEAALAVAPRYAAGARAAGLIGAGAPRRVRRWRRGLDALAHVLKALLPAVVGTWLVRVHAVVGAEAGAPPGHRSDARGPGDPPRLDGGVPCDGPGGPQAPTQERRGQQPGDPGHGIRLAPSTVHRVLAAHGVPAAPAGTPEPDARAFTFPHANDLWTSDVMHGPRLLVPGRRDGGKTCSGGACRVAFIATTGRPTAPTTSR